MKRKTLLPRIVSLLLVLVVFVTAMFTIGCDNENPNDKTTGTGVKPEDSQSVGADSGETTDRSQAKDNLPADLTFDGRTFTIWCTGSDELLSGPEDGISSAETAEEAAYNRNLAVMDRLDIDLVYHVEQGANVSTVGGLVSTLLLSGEETYDVYVGQQYGMMGLVTTGGFADAAQLDYIDFSQPWWNSDYMDEIAIGEESRYFLVGDYFINVLKNTFVLFYNEALYADIAENDEQIYEWVVDGTWTMDKMMQASRDAYKDMNNSGTVDENDQLGFICYATASSVDPFVYMTDIDYSVRDNEGNLTLNMMDERAVTLAEKIVSFFWQEGTYHQLSGATHRQIFANGTALFVGSSTLGKTVEFRDMVDDFGFLPYPKFDETQENYHSLVADVATVGAVSAWSQNLDMAGAVLEALSSETYRKVTPAYYEIELKVKYNRDEKKTAVIDMIADSSYTDFVFAYTTSLSSVGMQVRTLVTNNSTSYVSQIESVLDAANTGLEELVAIYTNMYD